MDIQKNKQHIVKNKSCTILEIWQHPTFELKRKK